MHAISKGMLAMAALAASCLPANAAVVVGTVIPPGSYDFQLATLPFSGAGLYRIDYDLSRPGTGELRVDWTFSFDWYDPDTGDWLGGDDQLLYQAVSFAPPRQHGAMTFKYLPPYDILNFWGRELGYYHDAAASLWGSFDGMAPVTYSLSVQRIADIPEPDVWALLIMGLGAAGAALRQRKQGHARRLLGSRPSQP